MIIGQRTNWTNSSAIGPTSAPISTRIGFSVSHNLSALLDGPRGTSADPRLDEVLNESIASTLKGILGEVPANALLYHVKIKPSAGKAEEFEASLDRILGSGSGIVKKLTIKAFYARLGIDFTESSYQSFPDSIAKAIDLQGKGGYSS
jgi:hypothetical protein